ncbi:hypothetical protein V2G26_016977 [Clonostachys chloroleuca]
MPPTTLPTITPTFLPPVANRSDVRARLAAHTFLVRIVEVPPAVHLDTTCWRAFGFNVASQITVLHMTSAGHVGTPTFEIFLLWFHPFSETIWTILRV